MRLPAEPEVSAPQEVTKQTIVLWSDRAKVFAPAIHFVCAGVFFVPALQMGYFITRFVGVIF